MTISSGSPGLVYSISLTPRTTWEGGMHKAVEAAQTRKGERGSVLMMFY
jgi:hypothetical protein